MRKNLKNNRKKKESLKQQSNPIGHISSRRKEKRNVKKVVIILLCKSYHPTIYKDFKNYGNTYSGQKKIQYAERNIRTSPCIFI